MIEILSPRQGAVLNRCNGRESGNALQVTVEGHAEPFGDVLVNGVRAACDGRRFSAPVRLTERVNVIRAETNAARGSQVHEIKVICDKASFKRYRFFIDDHIFFLDDIAQHAYSSIFDCFYLAELRRLHREYGMKVALNIFYRNDHGDFDLSRFPDRYRGEWADNADWLKLAFHAYSEFPNRPYQFEPPAKLAEDFDLVREQILRFAGEQTYSPPIVIHWAMTSPGCFQVLKERGVRTLSGQFIRAETGPNDPPSPADSPDIGYSLDAEHSTYLVDHSVLHDFEHDITFHRGDVCFNLDSKEQVLAKLERRCENPHFNEVVALASHEQYSFPFYANYIPDHFERMETGLRFVTERGYTPVFAHEGFLGNSAWS